MMINLALNQRLWEDEEAETTDTTYVPLIDQEFEQRIKTMQSLNSNAEK